MKNRTEEIRLEIRSHDGNDFIVDPRRLAIYLACLEARVEALEPEPVYAEFGGKHYKSHRGKLYVDGTKAYPKEQEPTPSEGRIVCICGNLSETSPHWRGCIAPKEPASWRDELARCFWRVKDWQNPVPELEQVIEAFIAEEKKRSYEEGKKEVVDGKV